MCKNGHILIVKYFLLQAHMKFPPDYPYSPPSVRFITKVWHPNVYEVRKNYKKQKNSSNFQNPNIWTDLLIVTLFVFTSIVHKIKNCSRIKRLKENLLSPSLNLRIGMPQGTRGICSPKSPAVLPHPVPRWLEFSNQPPPLFLEFLPEK